MVRVKRLRASKVSTFKIWLVLSDFFGAVGHGSSWVLMVEASMKMAPKKYWYPNYPNPGRPNIRTVESTNG